jgi:hypothetical protein
MEWVDLKRVREYETLYLTNFVGCAQHPMGGTPSDVAVKGDGKRTCDVTFKLKFVKGFNVLSWWLNLVQPNIRNMLTKRHRNVANLDG